MKQTINQILSILFAAAFFTSCSNDITLQRYFVNNQESKNFISQDLPLSMIELDKTNFTEEQKEAYNSVKKLNILGYKINEKDVETFNTELETVKTILSHDKYNDLIEFSDRGNKVHVKYIGTDEEADEVVVLGIAKDTGFGIVRVLGDDMSPEKMVTLIDVLQKANIDESQLQDIMNFFK